MRLKGRLVLDGVWYSAMKRAPNTVNKELRAALRKATHAIRGRASAKVSKGPGGRHPEKLSKSLKVRVKRLVGFVYSPLWYSRVQEEGTSYLPGGVLKPKRKKWMHFRVGEKWVKVKAVKLKGQFYLKGGLEESQGDIQKAVDEAGNQVARKVFGG